MKRLIISLKISLTVFLVFAFVFCFAFIVPSTVSAANGNKDVVRIDFVHFAKQGHSSPKQDPGYKLMGVQWNQSPVSYAINTASIPSGLDAAWVMEAFATSSEVWDTATSSELFSLPAKTAAHYGVPDGINAVEFGLYPGNSNVIAVTSVWYSRKTKAILEFDMLYNTVYTWGNALSADFDVMDLQNIATHELGHAIGLSDIYSGTYSDVTMYGYASYNETGKRDLAQPDITGLQLLYGR